MHHRTVGYCRRTFNPTAIRGRGIAHCHCRTLRSPHFSEKEREGSIMLLLLLLFLLWLI